MELATRICRDEMGCWCRAAQLGASFAACFHTLLLAEWEPKRVRRLVTPRGELVPRVCATSSGPDAYLAF